MLVEIANQWKLNSVGTVQPIKNKCRINENENGAEVFVQ